MGTLAMAPRSSCMMRSLVSTLRISQVRYNSSLDRVLSTHESRHHNVPVNFSIKQGDKLKDRGYNLKDHHLLSYKAAEGGRFDLFRGSLKKIGHEEIKIDDLRPSIAQVKDEAEKDLVKTSKKLDYKAYTTGLVTIAHPLNDQILKGSILPFSQLNLFQKLIFPYTYAVMYYMDFLVQYMPWWMAIIGTTATARIIFFPVVLKLNIMGIKTYNILPQTQKLQVKMQEAMLNGDAYNQAIAKTRLNLLNKENGLSLKSRLTPILLQAPMYASVFLLLRALTSAPAEGLSTGGALWFTDLTIPDPYYILPLLTSTTMFILLEYGLEGGANPTSMTPVARWMMRAIPIGMFAIIQNFPAATLLFWSTSNLFTLSYALILKNSWVKKKLGIPKRLVHKPEDLPLTNMSFKGQMSKAVEQGKGQRTSMDVRRLDDIAFRKAGVGPLRKTYKELKQ